ncbi:MAG: DUF2784 domain-containing protein [Oligoflexia bacterium]|nr:DUF2784 domain-containing protein [Oligoflexia bacterium]
MNRIANIVLLAHFLWVLAVLLPVFLIPFGFRRRWRWPRDRALRAVHLAMIGIVIVESLLGVVCPLTLWEDLLRRRAGNSPYGRSFVEHWVGRVLYYDFPSWVFVAVYLFLGFIILILYRQYPPD